MQKNQTQEGFMKKFLFFFTLLCICLQKALFAIPTYTCGYQKIDGTSSSYRARLWIQNAGVTTTINIGDSTLESKANSVTVYKNQLYIVGYEKNGSGGDPKRAMLWIRDLKGNAIGQTTLGTIGSEAYSTAIYQDQFYIVGGQTNATLWVVDKTGALITTKTFASANSTAHNILFYNNQFYVAGSENNPTARNAILWILDLSGNLTSSQFISTATSETHIYGMDVYSNRLYLGGEGKINGLSCATLWITDLSGALISSTQLGLNALKSDVEGLVVQDGIVYIAGYQNTNSNDFRAILWITDAKGSILKNVIIGDQNAVNHSAAQDITIYGNRLYITGSQKIGAVKNAATWITDLGGDVISFSVLGNQLFDSEGDGITVLKGIPSKGVNKFTPVRPLKGLW